MSGRSEFGWMRVELGQKDLRKCVWIGPSAMVIGGEAKPLYINATSTCDCGIRACFARESVPMLLDAGKEIRPNQRLAA
ncbi:MAG: hypothetical protein ACK5LJ_07440 [Paracoccus sp. (in: a-proteobacteria)]